jgi:hypothetical protein
VCSFCHQDIPEFYIFTSWEIQALPPVDFLAAKVPQRSKVYDNTQKMREKKYVVGVWV